MKARRLWHPLRDELEGAAIVLALAVINAVAAVLPRWGRG